MTQSGPGGHPSALMFDFNGTLSRDEDLLCELVIDLARERLAVVLTAADYYTRFAGLTEAAMFQVLGASRADALIAEFTERYLARILIEPRIPAETCALVVAAHDAGTPLAIVTAAHRTTVLPALEARGLLDRFAAIVTLDDVVRAKPDPEAYLLAAERLGIADRSTVTAFEDSRAGIAAARGAGMRVVAVAGTMPRDALAGLADEVVDRLDLSVLPGAVTRR